jgi:hypothetical protein
MRALRPRAEIRNVGVSGGALAFHRHNAAPWNGLGCQKNHVQQQLDAVFRHQGTRQVPGQLDLLVLDKAARDVFGVPKINLSGGRTGCPESDTAELQPRRRRSGAFLDEVESEAPGLFVGRLL